MSKPVTITEAARLIFRTDQPTPEQLFRVKRWMQSGALKATRSGADTAVWHTTQERIAEFLARRAAYGVDDATGSAGGAHTQEMKRLYQSLMKDYFLALIFRRRRHTSRAFGASVAAGQLVIVLLVAAAVVASTRSMFARPPLEHQLIEAWIDENYGEEAWAANFAEPMANPNGEGVVIETQFVYMVKNGRRVRTVQYFFIQDGKVVNVASEL